MVKELFFIINEKFTGVKAGEPLQRLGKPVGEKKTTPE